MKLGLSIFALVLVVMGALWALQGFGLVGGSFMVGQTRWLYIGLLTMVAGALLFFSVRRG